MSIRKQGRTWIFRRQVWKTLPSRREAELYGGHVESALAEAERRHGGEISPCCTIRGKLEEFVSDCQAGIGRRPCNEQTVRMHRKRLLTFDRAFHSRPLDAIAREEVEAWIKRRLGKAGEANCLSADTVNADMSSLRAFAKWAQAKGYAPALLPFQAVGRLQVKGKLPGTNRKPPKSFGISELLEVVARIGKEREDVGLLLEGMILFCLRPGALAKLKRRDLKLPIGNSSGSLESLALKGHFDRSLVIFPSSQQHEWARRCLALARRTRRRSLRSDEPLVIRIGGRSTRNLGGWTTDALDHVLARLCRRLELDFTAYQVRHSVISWLQENPGLSPAAVQATAGHSRIETQNAYGKRRGHEAIPAFKTLSDLMRQGRTTTTQEGHGGDVSYSGP